MHIQDAFHPDGLSFDSGDDLDDAESSGPGPRRGRSNTIDSFYSPSPSSSSSSSPDLIRNFIDIFLIFFLLFFRF